MLKKAQLEYIEGLIDKILPLRETASQGETFHRLDRKSAHAIIAAVAANRPLLVRGEPGVGKSQLARAAAYLLGRCYMPTVVQPDSDYESLLWSFDHTQRLAEAQLAATTGNSEMVKDSAKFVSPGPLWYALNWEEADKCKCKSNFIPPEDIDAKAVKSQGLVLLIDEVDKADISLANGLLEVLGNGSFFVPALGKPIRAESTPPLVVLTSNDTRELPPALQRRCVVLEICLESDDKLEGQLVKLGEAHELGLDKEVMNKAAAQIVQDRMACVGNLRTGLAEYLDLLRAIKEVSSDTQEQLQWVGKLSEYFYKSNAMP